MEGQDPALLVYTKDFLEGTADLSAAEFGAYVRLIFHQHQRKILPQNKQKLARLCGVDFSEFTGIWNEINAKFTLSDHGYYNKRCAVEIAKRSHSSSLKSIIAIFGNWLRYHKKLDAKTKKHLKTQFSAFDFVSIEDDEERKKEIINYLNSEALAFAKRSHIENGNENENEDILSNTSLEKKKFNFLKSLKDFGFKKDLAEEWMAVRKAKRKSNTKTAFEKFISEVEKTNKDRNEILKICVEKSWGTFEAVYLENIENQGNGYGKSRTTNNEPRINRQSISEVDANHRNISSIPNPLE